MRSGIFRGIVTADNGRERSNLVARALEELSVSRATFYRLFARFRASEVTSAVVPEQSGRKKGSHFLDARREAIIAREISSFYLKPERPRLSQLVEHVHALCHREGLPLVTARTILFAGMTVAFNDRVATINLLWSVAPGVRDLDFRPLVLSLNKYSEESHVNC